MTSAELRWFWRGRCPQPVYDWFFKSGVPPGGGLSRVDRYIPQRGEPDISIKRRGDKPDFEVKGLVMTRRSPELEPLAPHIEIWCKWSCTIRGLKLADEVAVTKTRWLRKFDTSKYVRSEIPLDANKKPTSGYSLLVQGCNIELTEVCCDDAGHLGCNGLDFRPARAAHAPAATADSLLPQELRARGKMVLPQ